MNGDGSFRGQVFRRRLRVSGLAMQYQFATPSPTSENSNDQYIFAATPEPAATPTP